MTTQQTNNDSAVVRALSKGPALKNKVGFTEFNDSQQSYLKECLTAGKQKIIQINANTVDFVATPNVGLVHLMAGYKSGKIRLESTDNSPILKYSLMLYAQHVLLVLVGLMVMVALSFVTAIPNMLYFVLATLVLFGVMIQYIRQMLFFNRLIDELEQRKTP